MKEIKELRNRKSSQSSPRLFRIEIKGHLVQYDFHTGLDIPVTKVIDRFLIVADMSDLEKAIDDILDDSFNAVEYIKAVEMPVSLSRYCDDAFVQGEKTLFNFTTTR